MHARERKKREREKAEGGRREGEGGRAGKREETERKNIMHMQLRPARNARTRKRQKELPVSCTEIHAKRTPRTIQKHLHRKKRSSCPKSCRKTRRNKNKRTPTNEAKTRRIFCLPLSGNQNNGFSEKFQDPKTASFQGTDMQSKNLTARYGNKTAPKRQGRPKTQVFLGEKQHRKVHSKQNSSENHRLQTRKTEEIPGKTRFFCLTRLHELLLGGLQTGTDRLQKHVPGKKSTAFPLSHTHTHELQREFHRTNPPMSKVRLRKPDVKKTKTRRTLDKKPEQTGIFAETRPVKKKN